MADCERFRLGRLTLVSNHPVLDQLARDMLAGVDPEQLPDRDICLYVGIHRNYKIDLFDHQFRVGMQTEQYFDENERPLRGPERFRTLLKYMLLFDVILDLSIANRPRYSRLPGWMRRKVHFGPHIFPSRPVSYRPGLKMQASFFGWVNERRSEILHALPPDYYQLLPEHTYGAKLFDAIATSSGVLNVHFLEGIYSEYPRLLTAYIAGKPFISERLSRDVLHEIEYAVIGREYTPEQLGSIFTAFRDGFAARHKLTDFLQARVQKGPSRKYGDHVGRGRRG